MTDKNDNETAAKGGVDRSDLFRLEGLTRYYGEPTALVGKKVRAAHKDAGVPDNAFVKDSSGPDTVYISTYFEDGTIDEHIGNRGLADIAFADPSDELTDKIMEAADYWAGHPTAKPDPRAIMAFKIHLRNAED